MPDALKRFGWLSIVVAVLLGATARALSPHDGKPRGEIAATDAPVMTGRSSLWLVSTRQLRASYGSRHSTQELDVRLYDQQNGWQSTSLADFHAADDPETTTLIYLHGNRFDWDDAIQYGWLARDALTAAADTSAPMRFVIWSWPSQKIQGPLRDARIKAQRADGEAFLLAEFLSGMDPQVPVSLIGSSYGARIITGSLHLLGGGQLFGATLNEPVVRKPMRAVLMASALNNDWLLPGGCHGQAFTQVDRLLLLYNSCDIVLKRYRLIDRCSRPEALGFTGLPACRGFDKIVAQFTQIDVCPYVGRSHREKPYFCCNHLMKQAAEYLLGE